ncbi:MAG: GNAT family N-acetyltransferase [Candidatus Hermodarchaeota archaeon]|nr:GNAT family N-acetyltransferase [Candidatus Hermodarchaeota archaeon]
MIRIESDRLIIRNFTVNDWEGLARIGMHYEASELAKYDYGPWPDSPDAYMEIAKDWSKKNEFVAVQLKKEQTLIGFIAMGQDEAGEYNLGYIFHPEFRGYGYAFEACQAVIRYLFEVIGVVQILSGTAKVNTSSRKLLKRLGFREHGESKLSFRKDSEGNPIEFIGIDFMLTREDWMKS